VLGAAGFHGDVDDRVAEIDAVVFAVVESFDDVDLFVGDYRGEALERAGMVRQMDAQANHAAVFDEAALDDAGEERDVDISSAHENADFFSL